VVPKAITFDRDAYVCIEVLGELVVCLGNAVET
jgi:hypothetical protein